MGSYAVRPGDTMSATQVQAGIAAAGGHSQVISPTIESVAVSK